MVIKAAFAWGVFKDPTKCVPAKSSHTLRVSLKHSPWLPSGCGGGGGGGDGPDAHVAFAITVTSTHTVRSTLEPDVITPLGMVMGRMFCGWTGVRR